MRRIRLVMLAMLASAAWGGDFWSGTPGPELAAQLTSAMSDRELATQVLVFGYPGETPPMSTLGWIRDDGLGGIKIFGWNANNLNTLTAAIRLMQRASQASRLRIPLFVATDQEGGWVRHVRFNTSMTSGNMSIGATGLPNDAYRTGYLIGMELRALGINFNFAPTVDIASNAKAHVIGPRAFSQDPVQTAILGVAFFKGLEKAGIIATAKHFPGHGDASGDSHVMLPRVMVDWDTLYHRELLPYKYLIRENLPAIMSGHLAFPRITGNEKPATLNSFLVTEVLRGRLGFRNLLITDDLFMEGARTTGLSLPEVAERAFRAGHDLILVSQPQDALRLTLERFTRLAIQDPAFRQRLQESVRRILTVKLRYLRGPNPVPLFPESSEASRSIPAEGSTDFFFQQAVRSVSILRPARLPWPANSGRVLLVTPHPRFHYVAVRRLPGLQLLEYGYNPFYTHDPAIRQALLNLAPTFDRILFNLVTPGSVELLQALEAHRDKVTVISQLTPVHIRKVPWVDSALAVWGLGRDNLDAGLAALLGDFLPTGRPPLSLDP